MQDTWTYNDYGEPESYVATFVGNELYASSHTYDLLGRINTRTETVGGISTTRTYHYDRRSRLEQVDVDSIPSEVYTYDANDNRTSAPGIDGTTVIVDEHDQLLAWNDATLSYTLNGEVESIADANGTTDYTYDTTGALARPGYSVVRPEIIDFWGPLIGRTPTKWMMPGCGRSSPASPLT